MDLQKIRMNKMELDNLFGTLVERMRGMTELEEKRNLVNSILPLHKYKLLRAILHDEDLSEEIRLKCLPIFLDERTQFFNFVQETNNQRSIKYILELIPKYCPNIKIVDLRSLSIQRVNTENFKTFLKQTQCLKSLRVSCAIDNCAISQLLLEEDFRLHEQDVQNGLLKIQYIKNAIDFTLSEYINFLKVLPNLKSLGDGLGLARVVTSRIAHQLRQKLSNLIEFHDEETSLNTLEHLIRFCPKAQQIHLSYPLEHVIENLSKFPKLTQIALDCENFGQIRELIQLLKIIGNQIKYLNIFTTDNMPLDTEIILRLCPELVRMELNDRSVINE